MSMTDALSALVVVAVCAVAAVAPLFTGCETVKRVDEAIWHQPPPPGATGADGSPAGDGQPVAAVPPLVEIGASLLALLGFGGMAGWIRRVKNTGNGRMSTLEDRVRTLENSNHN